MDQLGVPQWKLHEQWKIRMHVKVKTEMMPRGYGSSRFRETVFQFEVVTVSESSQGIEETTVIFMHNQKAYPEIGYMIYLRNHPVSLKKVVFVDGKSEKLVYENAAQTFYRPRNIYQYIFDFPAFPLTVKEREEMIVSSWGDKVYETISKDTNGFIVQWEMQEPLVTFGAMQQWEPGKPWYSTAERFIITSKTNNKRLYGWAELVE
jgi:hypothetical protein